MNDQRQFLEKFFQLLGGLQAIALAIAVAMLVVTVLLIVNTMRIAAFSRRRETGIMRLVGASNFYIQLPFLLEAAIAAVQGDRQNLTAEAADVLYHLLVVLQGAHIPLNEVMAELERRTAQSGLAEKAARKP